MGKNSYDEVTGFEICEFKSTKIYILWWGSIMYCLTKLILCTLTKIFSNRGNPWWISSSTIVNNCIQKSKNRSKWLYLPLQKNKNCIENQEKRYFSFLRNIMLLVYIHMVTKPIEIHKIGHIDFQNWRFWGFGGNILFQ